MLERLRNQRVRSRNQGAAAFGRMHRNGVLLWIKRILRLHCLPQFFVSFRDSAAVKAGQPGEAKGTWSYTGGTGKLKGITGKGTYTATNNADGTSVVDVEGEYAIPAAAPKKAAAKKSSY